MPRLRLLPPVEAVKTPEGASTVLNYLMNRGGPIAIDTETTGLDIMRDRVLYWSMATENRRWFFPHELLLTFDPLFHRRDVIWYLTNAKYDLHLLANMGIHLLGDCWDIVVMDAMEDDTRPHGLKEQSEIAYGAKWGEFKDLFLNPQIVSAELGFDDVTATRFRKYSVGDKLEAVYAERPDIVENYASCDAYFTYMRAEDLRARLAAIPLPTNLCPNFSYMLDYFRVLEVPLTKALWKMERTGFLVDKDYAKKIDGPMRDGIHDAEVRIKEIAGDNDFNPKSTDHLRKILFDEKSGFGLKPIKYTKSATSPEKSTDEKSLNILLMRAGKDSPPGRFLKALLDYRHLAKLHGTYVKKLGEKGSALGPDGRVHCRLNQAGARTSRLSSSDPNMQNIPARNDEYKIRGIFVAPPGHDLIDFDYPQIEFRIAAFLANEEAMMEPIRKGWDIHSANAVNMFKRDEFTYEHMMEARRKKDAKEAMSDFEKFLLKRRDQAKTVGLGNLYGEGAPKMASELKISVEEAEQLKIDFATAYPRIDAQIQLFHEFARINEFTHTMLGRIRRLHRINNTYNRGLVGAEERQAYNTLIQGTGAEMMKLAILRVDNDPDFRSLGAKLVLTVHDELIAEAPKDVSKDVASIMKRLMAEPFKWGPIDLNLPVPVDPDGQIGYRWSDVK
jgi:DNA polymerase I-like protein with 3'-5' exonuclease and polymerase domains